MAERRSSRAAGSSAGASVSRAFRIVRSGCSSPSTRYGPCSAMDRRDGFRAARYQPTGGFRARRSAACSTSRSRSMLPAILNALLASGVTNRSIKSRAGLLLKNPAVEQAARAKLLVEAAATSPLRTYRWPRSRSAWPCARPGRVGLVLPRERVHALSDASATQKPSSASTSGRECVSAAGTVASRCGSRAPRRFAEDLAGVPLHELGPGFGPAALGRS